MFYKGRYIEMLEETYDKFKKQLKDKKTGNDNLPEIVYNSDQQVHHICSYNYYRIKDDEVKLGLTHNDVYNTDELTHEFEYGLFEDIIKSEQLMADLKQIDEHEETLKEQMNQEFNYFPMEEFKDAGIVINDKDPELKLATQAELYTLEQQVLQQQQQEKCALTVSHVQKQHEANSTQDECCYHVHTVNCLVYVLYNDEKQEILIPSTTEMSRKENAKALFNDENIDEWNADPYFDETNTDTQNTFSYAHCDGPNQVMVQAVYLDNYSRLCADIKGETYSMVDYDPDGSLEGLYDNTYKIPMYVDNGTTVNLMPTTYYEQATFFHHLPKYNVTGETICTGNGNIAAHFWTDIQVNIQGCLIQLKVLVCDTQARTGILLSRMALEQLQTWQDYGSNTMYIKQTTVPLFATQKHEILPGHKIVIKGVLDRSMQDMYQSSYIQGEGICWIWPNDSSKPAQPVVSTFVKDKTLITFQNMSGSTQIIDKAACIGILDMRSKDGTMTSFDWEFPTDDEGNLVLYAHIFASSLEPTKLAKESPQSQADTCLKILQEPKNHNVNIPTADDPYPWLERDDPRRHMTDEEII